MKWYEELFKDYAEKYDRESFTRGTVGECDFIEREIDGDRKKRILDIGCGTGRHAIELARRPLPCSPPECPSGWGSGGSRSS